MLMTPLVHDKRFVEEFRSENVLIEDLPAHDPSILEKAALRLARESFARTSKVETVQVRLAAAAMAASSGLLRRTGALAVKLLRYLPPSFWYRVGDAFVHDCHARTVFARFEPDLVVTMKGGMQLWEVPVLKEARRTRTPTAVIGLSWDNLTTKLLPLRHADRLIVWNERMKQEAITVQGIESDRIAVSGIPHFDFYADANRRTPKEAFFKRLGLDPSRPLILFGTNHYTSSRECRMEGLVDTLYQAARRNEFGKPVQILVRLHPRDELEPYRSLLNRPGLVVEKPFHSWTMGGREEVCYAHKDFLHLADTLCHSDVLVNVFSTIMIEACIFDKPVVNAAFDSIEGQPFFESARRFTGYTHIKRITESGGVRVARNSREMIELVRFSLDQPEAGREERRRIVEDNCFRVDGRSGERQAQFVLESLHSGRLPS